MSNETVRFTTSFHSADSKSNGTTEWLTGHVDTHLGRRYYFRLRTKGSKLRYPHGVRNEAGSRSYIERKAREAWGRQGSSLDNDYFSYRVSDFT